MLVGHWHACGSDKQHQSHSPPINDDESTAEDLISMLVVSIQKRLNTSKTSNHMNDVPD